MGVRISRVVGESTSVIVVAKTRISQITGASEAVVVPYAKTRISSIHGDVVTAPIERAKTRISSIRGAVAIVAHEPYRFYDEVTEEWVAVDQMIYDVDHWVLVD